MSFILVMAGGAIGSGARYLTGRALAGFDGRHATLLVNLVGGLLMGVLAGLVARGSAGEGWRLFAGVGLLGGFTTFSAFSRDTVLLLQRGAIGAAAVYVLLSVAGSVAALLLGLTLVRAAA